MEPPALFCPVLLGTHSHSVFLPCLVTQVGCVSIVAQPLTHFIPASEALSPQDDFLVAPQIVGGHFKGTKDTAFSKGRELSFVFVFEFFCLFV